MIEERSYHDIFPYDTYRKKQETIIQNIIESLTDYDIVIVMLRNGAGKTITSLTSSLSLKSNGVIILGRTHGQMSHFSEEIDMIRKKRKYDLSYIELLSRKFYCINPKVLKSKEFIDNLCRTSISYYRNKAYCSYTLFNKRKTIDVKTEFSINDIKHGNYENVKRFARERKTCPYYLARKLAKEADIIIGTYMYIDRDIRRILNLNVNGKIIIFDECHNIINFLEEKQKYVINKSIIKNLQKQKIFTGELRTFISRLSSFIESFEKRIQTKSHKKLSYDELYNEMTKQGITKNFLQNVSDSFDAFVNRFPYRYELSYSYSKILSFFEMLEKIKPIAFIGYIDKSDDLEIGIQNLDIAQNIHELIDEGAKILFMSGTLNVEMFHFRLRLNKVRTKILEYTLDKRRVQTFIVTMSSNGVSLSTTYKSRNKEIITEYGFTIQELIDELYGGILIFFPSYSYKRLFVESLIENEIMFEKENELYIKDKNGRELRIFDNENEYDVDNFKTYVTNNDAILLSVYRSRSSEGEDFRNIKGIFVIGIPLANIKDAGTKLKIDYYNKIKTGYGNLLYTSDAMDAVNQACGRGIRKKNDFCVIFLMDTRFKQGRYFNYLSKWIRISVVQSPSISNHTPSVIRPVIKEFLEINEKRNKLIELGI